MAFSTITVAFISARECMDNAAQPWRCFGQLPVPGGAWQGLNRAGWAGQAQLSPGLGRDPLCGILGGLGGAGEVRSLRGCGWGGGAHPGARA